MSTEENKALVRRMIEEDKKRNLDGMLELYAPDYVIHGAQVYGLPPTFKPGLEGLKQIFTAFWTALPDEQMVVEDMIAEGDKVAYRLTLHATHQGEFLGIPPTGKVLTGTAIYISRFAGGKFVEDWRQADDLGLMQQLGAIPQMAQGGRNLSLSSHDG
jgi:steroid delta-isomerase-like uncharacterized protein